MDAYPILIVTADRLYAEFLRQIASMEILHSRCDVSLRVSDAKRRIIEETYNCLLVDLDEADGDSMEILAVQAKSGRRGDAIALTRKREIRTLAILRGLGVKGAFDSMTEGMDELAAALSAVRRGSTYWSASLLEFMLKENAGSRAIQRNLTRSEQRVLSIIGDGTDDKSASVILGLKRSTVTTIRRELHRKLRVRHRGELIRFAIVAGYVKIRFNSVVRSRDY